MYIYISQIYTSRTLKKKYCAMNTKHSFSPSVMVISVHSGTFDVENIHIHTRALAHSRVRARAESHSLAHASMCWHARINLFMTRARTQRRGRGNELIFTPFYITEPPPNGSIRITKLQRLSLFSIEFSRFTCSQGIYICVCI